MKKIISGILTLCFMLMVATSLHAQETLKVKKMEGHTWHQVVMVKFKPGTMNEAKDIIHNHFMKAGQKAEVPGPQMMEFQTGEWDMMFVWTMDSINDMNWEIHPDDEKWWAAMVEMEGGEEEANELWQNYMGMIESSTSYLATSQQQMSGETMGSNDQ